MRRQGRVPGRGRAGARRRAGRADDRPRRTAAWGDGPRGLSLVRRALAETELPPRVFNPTHVNRRRDAERADYLEQLPAATGIFITGGNQLQLSTVLGGTPVAQAIRRLNAGGVHVAGTSAGAAFLSQHMIAGGHSGPTPRPDWA